ncbi:MAG: hypothetical protein ACK559_13690, partial [bacterium]
PPLHVDDLVDHVARDHEPERQEHPQEAQGPAHGVAEGLADEPQQGHPEAGARPHAATDDPVQHGGVDEGLVLTGARAGEHDEGFSDADEGAGQHAPGEAEPEALEDGAELHG